jgi:serine/threonine protein kinase
VLDALAVELDLSERVGRVHSAFSGASWNALQGLSRIARALGGVETSMRAAASVRSAVQREISRRPRYQLGERLGSGGMGEVFRGWQIGEVGFERQVAIKRLLPKFAQSYPWLVAHEAGLLSRLVHPNIVHVLDVVRDDDGQPLLVLEYVDGLNLGELIDSGTLPVSVALFLAAEILNGLGYAHHLPGDGGVVQGILHRDLSPDNVLLSWDGAVKIADFGIAKERRSTEVSVDPGILGKPGYASPEQRAGRSLDGRSDLYSVGVILWEMLTSARVFGDEVSQLEQLPPPSNFHPTPREVESVVMKLLRRDRERRYRTAEAAYDDIAACASGSFLRARAQLVELLAQRFPKQVRRRLLPRRAPHTPTPPTPPCAPPPGLRQPGWIERARWWTYRTRLRTRQIRWRYQRRRARRLSSGSWWQLLLVMTVAVLLLLIR